MTDTPVTPAPVKKRRFGCFSIILLLVSLVLLAAAGAIWMAKSEPAQLKEMKTAMAAIAPQEQLRRADDLEARFASALQGIDSKAGVNVNPGSNNQEVHEHTITVTALDANFWLSLKLNDWLASRKASLPSVLADPRVWFEDGKLVISAAVQLPAVEGVASFVMDSVMQKDGQLVLKVAAIRTGKLRVPTGIVADQVRDEFKNAQEGVVKTLGQAFDGVTLDPVFPDPAGDKSRLTRLVDFKIRGDEVDLTFRNGPKEKIQAKK